MVVSCSKGVLIAGGICMLVAPVVADRIDLLGHVPESPTVFTLVSTVSGSSESVAESSWTLPETITGDDIVVSRYYTDVTPSQVSQLPDWPKST